MQYEKFKLPKMRNVISVSSLTNLARVGIVFVGFFVRKGIMEKIHKLHIEHEKFRVQIQNTDINMGKYKVHETIFGLFVSLDL